MTQCLIHPPRIARPLHQSDAHSYSRNSMAVRTLLQEKKHTKTASGSAHRNPLPACECTPDVFRRTREIGSYVGWLAPNLVSKPEAEPADLLSHTYCLWTAVQAQRHCPRLSGLPGPVIQLHGMQPPWANRPNNCVQTPPPNACIVDVSFLVSTSVHSMIWGFQF